MKRDMFVGEYDLNIDGSHRINIPKSFLKELETSFYIGKGFEKCIYIYSNEQWQNLSIKLNELSITKNTNRMFQRFFYSGTYEAELDSKGRVCINKKLFDYAGLDKECIIIGAGNHIEIWDVNEYESYNNENPNIMAEVSEGLEI